MLIVTYRSSRLEIWKWYWRSWAKPSGRWRFHLLFALVIAAASTIAVHKMSPFDWGYFAVAFAVGLLSALILLPLYPQIRIKTAPRTLAIDANGLTASVGKLSASRSWKDVRSIESCKGSLIITGTNKNAFIIPASAFASEDERTAFYRSALGWHASSIA
jgi:hypothetical protein